jgi:hypothetical protein
MYSQRTDGLNNPQVETNRFIALPFRIADDDESDATWREQLSAQVTVGYPEFRRARPFAPEASSRRSARLSTTFHTNAVRSQPFGNELGPNDSRDSEIIPASEVLALGLESVGLPFGQYNSRMYLIPIGADVAAPPDADDFSIRQCKFWIKGSFHYRWVQIDAHDWLPR